MIIITLDLFFLACKSSNHAEDPSHATFQIFGRIWLVWPLCQRFFEKKLSHGRPGLAFNWGIWFRQVFVYDYVFFFRIFQKSIFRKKLNWKWHWAGKDFIIYKRKSLLTQKLWVILIKTLNTSSRKWQNLNPGSLLDILIATDTLSFMIYGLIYMVNYLIILISEPIIVLKLRVILLTKNYRVKKK